MTNILFLVSGNGGLLKFLYSCIEGNILPNHRICAVITDRECGAVDFSDKHGIFCKTVEYDKNNRTDLLEALNNLSFDVAITNIHKLLDETIVQRFRGKLINVHPSLLPSFAGFHAIESALKYGVKFVGTTVHYVDEGCDTGEIIAQSVMPIISDELEAVTNLQFRAWCLNLLNVLLRFADSSAEDITEQYQGSVFNPWLCFNTRCFDESFWGKIRNY